MRLYNIAWTWAIFIHSFKKKVFIINYTSIKITFSPPKKKPLKKFIKHLSVPGITWRQSGFFSEKRKKERKLSFLESTFQ